MRNYFKIAFRNLYHKKGYTLLNVFGLTIGMTCCLLIFHYVSYERSFDKFLPNTSNLVRLRLDTYQKGQLAWKSATVYPAIGPTLKKEYPEVENFCRLHDAEVLLTNPQTNEKFHETKGYFADTAALDLLQVQLTEGSQITALNGPDKMVVSQRMAKKYFGAEPAVGKHLVVRDGQGVQTYEVTGVFKDYPANSHLILDYLISYATLAKISRLQGDMANATETSFGWYDFYTYLQLRPGTNKAAFELKLKAFTNKYINSDVYHRTNNVQSELHILPVTNIHLYSNYNQEAEVNGNGQMVSFLFLVALFIIGIAWINYITLATARSVERAKEVGVRKVLGAVRSGLVRQFMTESFLLNVIALLISLVVFFALLPAFDRFTGGNQLSGISLTAPYWLQFVLVFVSGTLLSGLYPAFVLSSFKPIKVLKGVFTHSSSGAALRKGLIVAQFSISVVLIAGTIIVYQQVNYMRRQQLGANINQTLVLEGAQSIRDSVFNSVFQPFKQDLLQQTGIKSITASSDVMGREIYWTSSAKRLDRPSEPSITLYHLGIDYDFIPSYQLQLVAGRNFSRQFQTDNRAVLLNEKAIQLFGFARSQDALNKTIVRGGDTMHILGVVSNFHQVGLQKPIDPMAFVLAANTRNFYSIKIATSDVQKSIASIQTIWNKYFPDDPFSYFFLNDAFNDQYNADALFGKVFGTFAGLAILIACFGVLGLSAYNVLQRTKEIGIRKILGATSQNLLILLSADFVRLIFIAFIIAIPVGWYVMHVWLQDFAYRIQVEWWVFLLAGCFALLIAFLTLSVHVLKAVSENPVKNLRSE